MSSALQVLGDPQDLNPSLDIKSIKVPQSWSPFSLYCVDVQVRVTFIGLLSVWIIQENKTLTQRNGTLAAIL